MVHTAFIALGSNLGNRETHFRDALGLLAGIPDTRVIEQSPWYESEPVGYTDQGWFLNGVVRVETALTPRALLQACQGIEDRLGRRRTVSDGPRTMDLDILFFDDRVVPDSPRLMIPHPRLHVRAFVLHPLTDLAPSWQHPLLQTTVQSLLSVLKDPHRLRPYVAERTG
jgi:2-amino-4-hydroxy-6-hydroxymethyldihydropteridine diphosphokinase